MGIFDSLTTTEQYIVIGVVSVVLLLLIITIIVLIIRQTKRSSTQKNSQDDGGAAEKKGVKASKSLSSSSQSSSDKSSIKSTSKYGGTDSMLESGKNSLNDKKMATSAQMYHYQHQKQQLADLQRSEKENVNLTSSGPPDLLSPNSEAEGDTRVYECKGPAAIENMEVRNPLFN